MKRGDNAKVVPEIDIMYRGRGYKAPYILHLDAR
jgi:hypothetical protein